MIPRYNICRHTYTSLVLEWLQAYMKNTQYFRHLSKGTSILKAGFETGIRALPTEVKEEVDRLLGLKYPPREVLRHVSQKFPNASLPSKTALYNYRNNYLEQSLINFKCIV